MQFRDLKTQYQRLKPQIDHAMIQVASDCNFISGQQVDVLEENLASYVGVKHCITCANGTDALSLAMMTLRIGKNDAVFVPDFTFFSSGEIVSLAGAIPVFVDVRENTFNIDPCSLENQIRRILAEGEYTPRAIIAVDLFGLPADFAEIRCIADKYNLFVIEDGAQGFGGAIRGKKACSFGDISTTSFFPAKPLGCYGDGGAIFTDNDQYADILKSLRIHGKGESKYDNIRIGMNSRLDTLQAAILSVKLKAFADFELESVNHIASEYTARLNSIVEVPYIPEGLCSSWAQYTIRLKNQEQREHLQLNLSSEGIPSMIYYQKPMHRQLAFDGGKYNDSDYCYTNELCKTVLSLPMHPYLTEDDVEKICDVIKMCLKSFCQ